MLYLNRIGLLIFLFSSSFLLFACSSNENQTSTADENIDSNDKIWNPNQTVLEFANHHVEFSGKVAAFGSWDVFPYIINSKQSGSLIRTVLYRGTASR